MVKKIAFIFAWLVFFVAALLFFAPKVNLYYLLEKELQKLHVVIDNETIVEHPFGLELEHADVYAEGIRILKVMELHANVWLVSNSIEAGQIRLDGVAKSFLPTKIEQAVVHYALWNPLYATFEAKGEFGVLQGRVALKERKVFLLLHPSDYMKRHYAQLLGEMKKNKEGGYTYEQSL